MNAGVDFMPARAAEINIDDSQQLIENEISFTPDNSMINSEQQNDDTLIQVEGMLPADVSGAAVSVLPEELIQPTEDKVLCAYDISLYSEEKEYEPDGEKIQVTISGEMMRCAAEQGSQLTIVHIPDSPSEPVSYIQAKLSGDTLTFETEAFSVFLIKQETSSVVTTNRNVYHFLTGEKDTNGNILNDPYGFSAVDENGTAADVTQQIVRNGDVLCQPPQPEGNSDKDFLGWYIVAQSTGESTDTYFEIPSDIDDRVADFENGVTVSADNVHYYVAPIYNDSYWLSFNIMNSNAPDLEPLRVNADPATGKFIVTSTELADKIPSVSGAEFGGWYLDRDYQTSFTDSLEITEDTAIYAKWTYVAGTAAYKYVYWEQLTSDRWDDTVKHYSYKSSETQSGTIGELTAVPTVTPVSGFTARMDSRKTIQPDGSTVINIYYDRDIRIINLNTYDDTAYTYTVKKNQGNESSDVYGVVDGEYVKLVRNTGGGGNKKWFYEGPNGVVNYSGTMYTRTVNSTATEQTYATLKGLYGQTFDEAGAWWPNELNWCNARTDGDPVFYDAFLSSESELTFWDDVPSMGVHLYKQTVDGSDYVLSDTIYIEENTYTFENLYQGYTVSQYSTSDPPTNWKTATVGTTVSGFTDLHIRFNRNTYNLIFQYADGTPYNTYSVNFGADLSGYADQALPPDTSSTAYTGWMINLNGAKMPAGDVYVYPSNHDASKPVYQVTLDLDGGAFPESWYSSSQGRDPELQNSFSTFYTVKSNDYIIEEYVNVEKKFKPDADGNYYYICVTPEFAAAHPDLPHIARYVEKDSTEASLYAACLAMYGGSPQTFSPMEESDGRYEFLGWYTSSDTEYDFDTPVSGDIVLTAKWQLIPAETRTAERIS